MTCSATLTRSGWIGAFQLQCAKKPGHKGKHEAPVTEDLINTLGVQPRPSRAWVSWL